MAYNIIRPRKGIKSLWDQYKSRIYKNGEMLVESPETGIGSGPVNIKFGDGVTDYENLPYAVQAPTDELVEGSKAPMTSGAGYNIKKMIEGDLPVSTTQQAAINKAKSEANSYTDTKVAALVNGAPATLDTLKEVSDALAENEEVVEALNAAIGGKANASHGNHVPATQTASNKKFLRNDNTWQEVTPANIGAAAASHSHGAANVTAGTFGGKVQANASAMATLTNAQMRDMVVLDSDPGEGATVSYNPGTIVWTK